MKQITHRHTDETIVSRWWDKWLEWIIKVTVVLGFIYGMGSFVVHIILVYFPLPSAVAANVKDIAETKAQVVALKEDFIEMKGDIRVIKEHYAATDASTEKMEHWLSSIANRINKGGS